MPQAGGKIFCRANFDSKTPYYFNTPVQYVKPTQGGTTKASLDLNRQGQLLAKHSFIAKEKAITLVNLNYP